VSHVMHSDLILYTYIYSALNYFSEDSRSIKSLGEVQHLERLLKCGHPLWYSHAIQKDYGMDSVVKLAWLKITGNGFLNDNAETVASLLAILLCLVTFASSSESLQVKDLVSSRVGTCVYVTWTREAMNVKYFSGIYN
jgi:hypothetical protein